MRRSRQLHVIITYTLLILGALIMITPFIYMRGVHKAHN